MSYIQDSLSTGEETRALFRLHWIAKIPMIFWILLAVAALLFLIVYGRNSTNIWMLPGIAILGIALISVIWEWLKLRSIEQGVTNKRVVLKTGIISRKSEEMKLSSIETVEITQGIMGRIFGFGTVTVTGRGISDLIFSKIDDPIDVKRRIESIEPT